MTTPDNYADALVRLRQAAAFLYGGHYEPKSTRDTKLADEIEALIAKHMPKPNEYILLCKMPEAQEWTQVHGPVGGHGPFITTIKDEAETFRREMVAKWPTTKYRVVEIKYEDSP